MIKVFIGKVKGKVYPNSTKKFGFYEDGEQIILYRTTNGSTIGSAPRNSKLGVDRVLIGRVDQPTNNLLNLNLDNFEIAFVGFAENKKELGKAIKAFNHEKGMQGEFDNGEN